ncbi:MBG domain-containing protein, partial [Mitsuokella multacida]
GTVDKAFTSDIQGLTNGDDASIVNLTYATKGYLSNTKTNDVGDYDINTSVNELKNYDVKTNTAKLHINKAALFVNTDDKTTTYGTVDKAFTSDI